MYVFQSIVYNFEKIYKTSAYSFNYKIRGCYGFLEIPELHFSVEHKNLISQFRCRQKS